VALLVADEAERPLLAPGLREDREVVEQVSSAGRTLNAGRVAWSPGRSERRTGETSTGTRKTAAAANDPTPTQRARRAGTTKRKAGSRFRK
jgi:hypothetical protein